MVVGVLDLEDLADVIGPVHEGLGGVAAGDYHLAVLDALLDEGQLIFCEEKDALLYGYSVLKGTREQLERLDRSELIGLRETSFGFDALVERSEENRRRFEGLVFDRCTLEEMVLYFIRGKKR